MRRRVKAVPAPDSSHGFLLECERQAEAAGDARRLVQVRSWLSMLHHAGDDPELAEFFAAFAREEG